MRMISKVVLIIATINKYNAKKNEENKGNERKK